ncbi:unnamed protein product [Vicia faba]|uniref:Peroxidase n=1 Tax=Vicia faba TaxID=3906 RepID=A0AAV1B3Q2_VICFA|nr:unnamed protein product [Vicia faba]
MAYRMITTSFVVTLVLLSTICDAQLSSTFYDTTCPDALTTIRTAIRTAVSKERRMAASLIRLHFHDCFVQGCDASILLNDSTTIESEKTALPNLNSVRGFQVIDNAKSQVEKVCPGVVSCADIVAVAARDASFAVGGPSWTVKLGRRDSTTASKTLANTHLPLFTDDLQTLISKFTIKDLTAKDMVTLSGAHTIGQAQCFTFRDRIYNNASDIDAGFASTRQRGCPSTSSTSNNQNGGSTDSIVSQYSQNPTAFKSDFAAAMIKMGDIQPLTGSAGIIRSICSAPN